MASVVGGRAIAGGYRLLSAFKALFDGKIYRHRIPNQGDAIVLELFEDLYGISSARMSPAVSKYCARVDHAQRVVNPANVVMGSRGRRGDGTFGDPVHGTLKPPVDGYRVARARTSTCEIGVEVKIISASMGRQIGRVTDDLATQARYFQNHSPGGSPIKIAIVAINHAPIYCSYEGQHTCSKCGYIDDMCTTTTGRGKTKHPSQEASAAIAAIRANVLPLYDRTLLLEYSATNMVPFPFSWNNQNLVQQEYSALLTWLAAEYENRF